MHRVVVVSSPPNPFDLLHSHKQQKTKAVHIATSKVKTDELCDAGEYDEMYKLVENCRNDMEPEIFNEFQASVIAHHLVSALTRDQELWEELWEARATTGGPEASWRKKLPKPLCFSAN